MPTCHGRTAQMSVCPLLLLVLCALHSLPAGVQAASRFSGFPVDLSFPPSPHTPLPRPALAHLNTTAFDLAACTFTFAQFEEAHSGWATCFNAPEVSVHTCPRHCLQAMRATATADPSLAEVPVPLVLGSGLYHANLSICLAAIHAGAIDEKQGGAMHVFRFYPVDWSGGDTQTVWPGQFAEGSAKHDVTLKAVPADEIVHPAPEQSGAWAVRRRGSGPRQVQRAPFSPRSGHLHAVLWPQLQLHGELVPGRRGRQGLVVKRSRGVVQLLAALHNRRAQRDALSQRQPHSTQRCTSRHDKQDQTQQTTHTLYTTTCTALTFMLTLTCAICAVQDVWLYHSLTGSRWNDLQAMNRFNSRNGRWARLPMRRSVRVPRRCTPLSAS